MSDSLCLAIAALRGTTGSGGAHIFAIYRQDGEKPNEFSVAASPNSGALVDYQKTYLRSIEAVDGQVSLPAASTTITQFPVYASWASLSGIPVNNLQ